MSSSVSKSFLLPGKVLRFRKLHTKFCQDISESQDTRSLLIGLFTTAFAGLCFTSGNTMVKLLPPGSSYDILLLRSLIQVLIIYRYIMNISWIFCWMTRSQQLFFLQMQLMLPLVIRADSGFYGSEDWSTRLDCVCVPKWNHFLRARPCLTSLFRWRVVAQGAMGGFLLLSVMQAVSRWTNIPLIMFRYVALSHLLHYNSAIIFLCRLPLGDSTAIFFSSPAITMILSFFLLK